MLLTVDIEQKSMGNKELFHGLKLSVEAGEKVAIIGRNGVGKTTLFRMLTGEDTDFAGDVITRQGLRMVATRQEHHDLGDQTVVAYVLANLPEYAHLQHVIDTYPETMGDNMRKIEQYSEALERFTQLDYHTVEDRVRQSLTDYQLPADMPMRGLSGGQKRLVELVRIEHSSADLALIDEPTNHMDYVAKAAFIDWYKSVKYAVVAITHDRDLLQVASRIIEIKDQAAYNFPGNYDDYLRQNAARTSSDLNEYETTQRRIANIKKQIQYARSKKSSWTGTADKKNPFVVMETRLLKEMAELTALERPSFWIDQESVTDLKPTIADSYQKHKARTIRIRHGSHAERQRELLVLENVTVGYNGRPLFEPLTKRVLTGDRTRLVGRNGVGKTTLIRAITDVANGTRPATLLHGTITTDTKLRINAYDQEVADTLLDMTLAGAIEHIYQLYDLQVNSERIMQLLSDYLFDPYGDRDQPVRNLSGGQKARLQLIKLFANDPNLIILDEPTNHLDLPSIEELEAALATYHGALLYISHDSYVAKHLGGEEVAIVASPRQ
ncbi:MAG TPA: ABC-F family ATP-binding cassette domain-containing protein [Candidatus Saccharimonadales bacterium]|nr:ABC-F family ATP-binding cassette domain-containing protein [Candidatus Saccharimonadales bacterium]